MVNVFYSGLSELSTMLYCEQYCLPIVTDITGMTKIIILVLPYIVRFSYNYINAINNTPNSTALRWDFPIFEIKFKRRSVQYVDVNKTLEQYDDLLLINRRNQFVVFYSSVCVRGCNGFRLCRHLKLRCSDIVNCGASKYFC